MCHLHAINRQPFIRIASLAVHSDRVRPSYHRCVLICRVVLVVAINVQHDRDKVCQQQLPIVTEGPQARVEASMGAWYVCETPETCYCARCLLVCLVHGI